MTDDEMKSETASTPHMPTPRRNWWRTFVLTGVIFLSGIVVGATTASFTLWFQNSHANRTPRFQEERLIRHLERQFDLGQEQRREIHAIVRRHHQELKQIREETEPRVREVFESMRKEIESVLSLDDLEQWTYQFERMEKRWLGPHPPSGRPHRRGDRGDRPSHRRPNLRDIFQDADRDHDGHVSLDEYTDANYGDMNFDRIDRNQDGLITMEEFRDVFRRHRDRRPPPEEAPLSEADMP